MEPSVVDNKGFTGQEELDKLALVHLNGRIYDPFVARFISADPEIQDPEHSQSYNRYTYVWNNPTNFTDPTGFLTKDQTQALKAGTAQTKLADGTLVGLQGTFDENGNLVSLTVTLPGESTNKTLSFNGVNAGATITLTVAQSGSNQSSVGRFFSNVGGAISNAWDQANRSFGVFDQFVPGRASFESGASQLLGGPCFYSCTGHDYLVQSTADVFQGAAQGVAEAGNRYYPELAKIAITSAGGELLGTALAGKVMSTGAESVADAARLRGQFVGQEISGGHAFEKHVLDQGEFKGLEIRTRDQFASHIEDVVNHPTSMKGLSGGRSAYWDEKSGTVVIRNPKAADGGTAFQPVNGRTYFDNLR